MTTSNQTEALRILLVSRHFLNGTSEGLCAGRVADSLARRGHQVDVVAGPPARVIEDLAEDSLQKNGELNDVRYHLERVSPDSGHFIDAWSRLNRNASATPAHRLLSSVLNLRRVANAEEWAWVQAAARAITDRLAGGGTSGRGPGSTLSYDVIFSRLNPVASHLAVLEAQSSLGRGFSRLPWCAYFSDPWPLFIFPDPFDFGAGSLSRWRGLQLLRKIAGAADTLLFPSERLARFMAEWMVCDGVDRESFDRKTYVAPHVGVTDVNELQRSTPDSDAPVDAAGRGRTSKLVLRHAGFLMKERRIEPLLCALEQLPDEVLNDLSIEFKGRGGGEPSSLPRRVAPRLVFEPPSSPRVAQQWLNEADVSLLVESDLEEGIFLPSKFAEYASLQSPILALSPRTGTVADFLEKGGGLLASPGDASEISAAIMDLHRRWRQGTLGELAPPAELSAQFSPEAVAVQVEKALLRAIDERRNTRE